MIIRLFFDREGEDSVWPNFTADFVVFQSLFVCSLKAPRSQQYFKARSCLRALSICPLTRCSLVVLLSRLDSVQSKSLPSSKRVEQNELKDSLSALERETRETSLLLLFLPQGSFKGSLFPMESTLLVACYQ